MTILFYVNSPSYFQQRSVDLDISFPNSSVDSTFEFWNVGLGLCIFPSFSRFIKRWEIGIFENLRLHFQIFPNSLKSLKIQIFTPLPSYLVKWCGWSFNTMTCGIRGAKQFMIKLVVFKQKCWYYNVGNNFVSV